MEVPPNNPVDGAPKVLVGARDWPKNDEDPAAGVGAAALDPKIPPPVVVGAGEFVKKPPPVVGAGAGFCPNENPVPAGAAEDDPKVDPVAGAVAEKPVDAIPPVDDEALKFVLSGALSLPNRCTVFSAQVTIPVPSQMTAKINPIGACLGRGVVAESHQKTNCWHGS